VIPFVSSDDLSPGTAHPGTARPTITGSHPKGIAGWKEIEPLPPVIEQSQFILGGIGATGRGVRRDPPESIAVLFHRLDCRRVRRIRRTVQHAPSAAET
jgi:hypothetical protein